MAAAQAIQICSLFSCQSPNTKTQQTQPRSRVNSQLPCLPNTEIYQQFAQSAPSHTTFDEIPQRDAFAWNSLIRYHLANDGPSHAISIYHQMLLHGARPDKYTLPLVLTASRLSDSFFRGRQIHAHALKLGFGSDGYVVTALMALYGQFDGADTAQQVFDKMSKRNSVSWTLLAGLYEAEDRHNLALDVFNQMVESGTDVDSVALVTAIGACGSLKSLHEGRKIHKIARKIGLESDVLVGNSLLKMYFDCGSVKETRAVFDQMSVKDPISWTAVISMYVQNGSFNEGLKLFRAMNLEGMKPDSFSVSSVLPACARVSAGKHGKEIHACVIRNEIDLYLTIQNALMDMYVKSGFLQSASKIFERMSERDAISWTVMILGHSLHGQGEVGVKLFHEMEKQSGIQPDQASYFAVLHACNTAQMVEEGMFYFNCIREPKVEHYAMMVCLLTRAKCFDEARAFIEEHRIDKCAEVQSALLEGCRIHQNVKLGKQVAKQLIELEPLNAENYIMLSNIYAASGKWDAVDRLKQTVIDAGLKPKKAYSWIEVRNKVHVFGIGEISHPRSQGIYGELEGLMEKMKGNGYVPGTDFALHDVHEERECIPCGHSEMLAIAFGLISTQMGLTLRITKNHRVCGNCHSSAKLISKMVKREIVLKDPDRFHHFKDGFCSCRDFW